MTNFLGIELNEQQLRGVTQALQVAGSIDIGRPEIARDIRLVAVADVDERFDSAPGVEAGGVVYGGVYWPPLAESTLEQNPARFWGRLLRETGELQQSFTGNGQVFETGFQQVIFGSALPKARGLHFGVFWGQEIPERSRPLVIVHDQLANDVAEVVGAYIDQQLRRA